MTVIPFKPRQARAAMPPVAAAASTQTPTVPESSRPTPAPTPAAAKRIALTKPQRAPRKQPGTLEISPVPKKQRPKGSSFTEGWALGRLTVGGHTVEFADGHILGLAAFVMGASSVTVKWAPLVGYEPRIKSNVHFNDGRIEKLCYATDDAVKAGAWFVKRFDAALHSSTNATKQPESLHQWWSTESLPKALALVPEDARKFTAFKRAPAYDDNGMPLTAADIERRARTARLFGRIFGNQGNAFVDKPAAREEPMLDWSQIGRYDDPHDPVELTPQGLVQVWRLLRRFHFPRIPKSYAEVNTLVYFHMAVDTALYSVDPADDQVWRASCLKVHKQNHRDTYELFEACVQGDEARVKAVQAKKDWLVELAKEYDAEEDQPLGRDYGSVE